MMEWVVLSAGRCDSECVEYSGVGMLACQVIGSVLPVVNNVLLSYKQHCLERNVLNALNIVQNRQTELENRMNELLENNPTFIT